MSILVIHAYIWQQLWRSYLQDGPIIQYIIAWVFLLKPNQTTQDKSLLIWDENGKICSYSLLTSQTDIAWSAAVFRDKQLWQNPYPDLLHTAHKFNDNEFEPFFGHLFYWDSLPNTHSAEMLGKPQINLLSYDFYRILF